MSSTVWSFDWADRVRIIYKRRVKVEEQLTEMLDHRFGQRQALAKARYLDGDCEPIMLKIRYDLNPQTFGIQDQKFNRENADHSFLHEVNLIEKIHEIGHGLELIDHASQRCGKTLPYPEGWVDFAIMTRVSGERLGRIFLDLSHDQLDSIQDQLAYILEHMRQNGYLLSEQHPDFLQYDRENDKVYLVDVTYLMHTDPTRSYSKPITRNTSWVVGFNIWRDKLER